MNKSGILTSSCNFVQLDFTSGNYLAFKEEFNILSLNIFLIDLFSRENLNSFTSDFKDRPWFNFTFRPRKVKCYWKSGSETCSISDLSLAMKSIMNSLRQHGLCASAFPPSANNNSSSWQVKRASAQAVQAGQTGPGTEELLRRHRPTAEPGWSPPPVISLLGLWLCSYYCSVSVLTPSFSHSVPVVIFIPALWIHT